MRRLLERRGARVVGEAAERAGVARVVPKTELPSLRDILDEVAGNRPGVRPARALALRATGASSVLVARHVGARSTLDGKGEGGVGRDVWT